MLDVWFHKQADDALFKFAVIISRANDRWVFCKHRERTTYECPGGHREPDEAIDDTARRELFEETGAIEFSLMRVCPYSVTDDTGERTETYGMLYYADVTRFGVLPDFEMEKILLLEELPECWTYPVIQPRLVERVREWLADLT
ncbi:MAG: NUDIX domain-containing protein [Acetanaerobacterium sp.]